MSYDYEELMDDISYAEDDLDLGTDQMEALVDIMNNPLVYIEKNLKIQDKRSNLIPFKPNEGQIKLNEEIERQEKLGKPIRIIILKARQIGFSTFIAARFYHKSATQENTNTGIVAHKNDISTSILEKMKLFFEESPLIYKPMRKACNAKRLLFENPSPNENIRRAAPGLRSKIIIESAANKTVFRGETIHYLHLSELAFWPYSEVTLLSALQAVPNEPNTAVIIESTANGVGGVFYEEWLRAINGDSEFTPLFFPWFEHSEYTQNVPEDYCPSEDEEELKKKYGLTDGQICWRRWCISANCGGDLSRFKQEYPSEWREAFLASGRPVFDVDKIDVVLRGVKDPKFVGRVVFEKNKPSFRTEFNGNFRIWEKPQPNEKYVIGVDPSGGDRGGDPAAIAVYKHRTMTQVAEWHGYMAPDLLAVEATAIALYYNEALIVPEANNHGGTFISVIRNTKYSRLLFRRRNAPDARRAKNQEKFGFLTLENSKKLIIDGFSKFIREGADRIKSKQALQECVTYVYDDNNRSNAQSGCHDDLVIAHALAVYGCTVRPYTATVFKEESLDDLYSIDSCTGY